MGCLPNWRAFYRGTVQSALNAPFICASSERDGTGGLWPDQGMARGGRLAGAGRERGVKV
jgi:hypothetical protein